MDSFSGRLVRLSATEASEGGIYPVRGFRVSGSMNLCGGPRLRPLFMAEAPFHISYMHYVTSGTENLRDTDAKAQFGNSVAFESQADIGRALPWELW